MQTNSALYKFFLLECNKWISHLNNYSSVEAKKVRLSMFKHFPMRTRESIYLQCFFNIQSECKQKLSVQYLLQTRLDGSIVMLLNT